jgi:sulfate permease, SulP family
LHDPDESAWPVLPSSVSRRRAIRSTPARRSCPDGRPASLRAQWWRDPRTELLAGLVVALALIPEAIAFSLIAGVDPKVGLYASFSIAIIIAIAGAGRR